MEVVLIYSIWVLLCSTFCNILKMRQIRLTALTGITETIKQTAAPARALKLFYNSEIITIMYLGHTCSLHYYFTTSSPRYGSFPDKLTYNMLWEHCYFGSTFSIWTHCLHEAKKYYNPLISLSTKRMKSSPGYADKHFGVKTKPLYHDNLE